MLLDKSSCTLLTYLISLDSPKTIMTISRSLQQSRRKIYYHLDKINNSFPETVEKIEAIPRVGILLTHEQKLVCQELLAGIDSYSYVLRISVLYLFDFYGCSPLKHSIRRI